MARSLARPTGAWICVNLLIAAGLMACNGGEADRMAGGLAPIRSDSGAIEILEYALGAHDHSGSMTWTLASEPELHIGVASGDSAPQLLAGVAGAALLPDGRIAIGLRGSSEIRVFETTGAFARSIGGNGSGPGEFRSVSGPWLLDDGALAAYDVRAHRVSVFDTAGAVLRTTTYVSALDSSSDAALAHIAGFIGEGTAVGITQRGTPRQVGVSRGTVKYVALDSAGQFGVRLDSVMGGEVYMGESRNGFAPMATPPFALRPLAAAGPGVLAVADNATYDIRILSPQGVVTTIIRADVPPQPVLEADFRALAVEQAAAYGIEVTDAMMSPMREMTVHEYLPVLDTMFVGRAGALWVQEFARPGSATSRVAVYAPDGSLRGLLELPTEMTLLTGGDDRVVVLVHDDDGVEMVDVVRLVPRSAMN